MIPAAADLWQIGSGHIARLEEFILWACAPVPLSPGEDWARHEHTNLPPMGELMEESSVVEAAPGFSAIGK